MTDEKKTKWINIRINPSLLERLREESETECRSIAGQVLFIIENHFKDKEK